MTTLAREQIFPYDVGLSKNMERLGEVRRRADRTPIDYSRLGGMALAKRGDMHTSFFDAAMKAKGQRDLQEQQRRSQWAEAASKKEAATLAAQAKAATALVGGITKIGQGIASEAAAGTGPKAEKFREFLTKAYSGRWNPKTNNWTGAGTNPFNAPVTTTTPAPTIIPATIPGATAGATAGAAAGAAAGSVEAVPLAPPQAEVSPSPAVASETSEVITFPNDPYPEYEYQKIDGVWKTRKQGAADWVAYDFPKYQLDKFEQAIGGI